MDSLTPLRKSDGADMGLPPLEDNDGLREFEQFLATSASVTTPGPWFKVTGPGSNLLTMGGGVFKLVPPNISATLLSAPNAVITPSSQAMKLLSPTSSPPPSSSMKKYPVVPVNKKSENHEHGAEDEAHTRKLRCKLQFAKLRNEEWGGCLVAS